MNALRRWRALPAKDRILLPALMLGLPLASLALWLFGYGRTRRWIERLSRHPAPHAADAGEIEAARHLAQLAALAGRRGPVETTCLRQALVVHGMLRRRGLQPVLKLGVRRDGDAIAAHAWVELEGAPLAQRDAGFSAFPADGPDRRTP